VVLIGLIYLTRLPSNAVMISSGAKPASQAGLPRSTPVSFMPPSA